MLTLLAVISFSVDPIRLIQIMFGNGKPVALQVKLAGTPLTVGSKGEITVALAGP